jgi:dihydroorotate dehydrogenase electron transfer subunit
LDWARESLSDGWIVDCFSPLLRRAFSIAGLRRVSQGVEIDVMYRVVGTATRWMESRRAGDVLSVLGPAGNGFPISDHKPLAWLVAGGVGIPPLLWLAEALAAAGRKTIAFCGAKTSDLLALTLDSDTPSAPDAGTATYSATEFSRNRVPVVISTDDGTLGFHGHVGQALQAYARTNTAPSQELVIYTCGPDPLMWFVGEWCREHGIECYVCMERAMACGMGTCQSCVVPVRNDGDGQGWQYQLCCTQGPVFKAHEILWDSTVASSDNRSP